MGLFGNRRKDASAHDPRIAVLEDQVASLAASVERARAEAEAVRFVADQQPSSTPLSTPLPPTSPPRLLDADETEAAITDLRAHLWRIDEHLALLDRRITSVGTELAGQLTELGDAIEALEAGALAAADGVSTADREVDGAGAAGGIGDLLDELRAAQERLAAEQARYQIAFREDLAEIADRLPR